MDAQICLAEAAGDELRQLSEWLSDEKELRGHVTVVDDPIGHTALGSAQDSLSVALGAGGAGTVLASSLITWLRTRVTRAKITVESAGHSITFDIRTVGKVESLLKEILSAKDAG